MFRYLKELNKIIKLMKNNQRTNLGRWNIENCNVKTNRKIDFANEDHCGPCGNNLLNNQVNKTIKKYT